MKFRNLVSFLSGTPDLDAADRALVDDLMKLSLYLQQIATMLTNGWSEYLADDGKLPPFGVLKAGVTWRKRAEEMEGIMRRALR